MLKVWVEEHWKTGSSCLTGQDLVLQYPVSTTLMTSKYSYELSRCSSVTAVVLPLGSTGFARYWNFQLSVKNNSGLFCFCITSLGVWSRKLTNSTDLIHNEKNQSLLGRSRFPALWTGWSVSTLSSLWLLKIFSFFLIGRCNNFGFVLLHSIEKFSICSVLLRSITQTPLNS